MRKREKVQGGGVAEEKVQEGVAEETDWNSFPLVLACERGGA